MDLPAIRPIPEQIVHPQVEDVGTDTPVKDGVIVEEDSNTCIAEEEGVVQLEEEGAAHVEEEGASTDADCENADTEHHVGVAQGGYNLRPNRSREYSHRFDPSIVLQMCMPLTHQKSQQPWVHGQELRNADSLPMMCSPQNSPNWTTKDEPIQAADLTKAQQTNALQIINLIKEKCNG